MLEYNSGKIEEDDMMNLFDVFVQGLPACKEEAEEDCSHAVE